MSQLIVIGKKGREEYEWNPSEPSSTRVAERIFEEKIREGYAAFEIFGKKLVRDSSSRNTILAATTTETVMGEQIHEFDTEAETIQMTPPMVGG